MHTGAFPSLFTRRVALIHIALENCSYILRTTLRYYYYPHFADGNAGPERLSKLTLLKEMPEAGI